MKDYNGEQELTSNDNEMSGTSQVTGATLEIMMRKGRTCRETHDTEDPVKLIVMERVAGFDVLLTTVEYRL